MAEHAGEAVRIAILGANGQVGWELQRSLQPLGEVIALDRAAAPLDDLARLQTVLDGLEAQVLINAAAHTAVDKAESEPELAHRINAEAPAALARWAKSRDTLLVHYSTDYVFDGSGTHFRREEEATNPLSVYGASKLAGEKALVTSGCAYMCFRTSWVYAARGGNFAKTMLRLAKERDKLGVVADQWGAPTGADLIADVSAQVIAQHLREWQKAVQITKNAMISSVSHGEINGHGYEKHSKWNAQRCGIFHLVAAGVTNWHEYAVEAIERARQRGAELRVPRDAISAISSDAYPMPAKRPQNSRLSCAKLESTFGLRMPPWQTGVHRLIDLTS